MLRENNFSRTLKEVAFSPFCCTPRSEHTQRHELQPAGAPRTGAPGDFVRYLVANVNEFDFPAEGRGEGVWLRATGRNVGRV